MCDELDIYFTKALLAQQLRLKRAHNEKHSSEPATKAPAKPAEPERTGVKPERVPA